MNQFSEAVGRRLPGFARPMAKRVLHAWARIDSDGPLLPDYLIIGTQRGGTSSLYNYLVQHPAVGRALTNYNATRSAGMDPATRARLSGYFRSHSCALYAELGRDFGWS